MRGTRVAAVVLGMLSALPASAGKLTVPLEIGAGPASHTWFGAVAKDQPVHGGLVITTDIVLDRRWLRENRDRVPERWRAVSGAVDEVRVRPLPFLPETLIISPKFNRTGMIGASWRPLAIGTPLFVAPPVTVGVDVGARLTAIYLWGTALPDAVDPKATFFLRPGVDLAVDAVFPLSDTVRIRVGGDGHAYLPQAVGGFGLGEKGGRMWALARGFVELRVRAPIVVDR